MIESDKELTLEMETGGDGDQFVDNLSAKYVPDCGVDVYPRDRIQLTVGNQTILLMIEEAKFLKDYINKVIRRTQKK